MAVSTDGAQAFTGAPTPVPGLASCAGLNLVCGSSGQVLAETAGEAATLALPALTAYAPYIAAGLTLVAAAPLLTLSGDSAPRQLAVDSCRRAIQAQGGYPVFVDHRQVGSTTLVVPYIEATNGVDLCPAWELLAYSVFDANAVATAPFQRAFCRALDVFGNTSNNQTLAVGGTTGYGVYTTANGFPSGLQGMVDLACPVPWRGFFVGTAAAPAYVAPGLQTGPPDAAGYYGSCNVAVTTDASVTSNGGAGLPRRIQVSCQYKFPASAPTGFAAIPTGGVESAGQHRVDLWWPRASDHTLADHPVFLDNTAPTFFTGSVIEDTGLKIKVDSTTLTGDACCSDGFDTGAALSSGVVSFASSSAFTTSGVLTSGPSYAMHINTITFGASSTAAQPAYPDYHFAGGTSGTPAVITDCPTGQTNVLGACVPSTVANPATPTTPTTVATPTTVTTPATTTTTTPATEATGSSTNNDFLHLGDRITSGLSSLGNFVVTNLKSAWAGIEATTQGILTWGFNLLHNDLVYLGQLLVWIGGLIQQLQAATTAGFASVVSAEGQVATVVAAGTSAIVSAISAVSVPAETGVATAVVAGTTATVAAITTLTTAVNALPASIASAMATQLQTLMVPTSTQLQTQATAVQTAWATTFPAHVLTTTTDIGTVITAAASTGLAADPCGPDVDMRPILRQATVFGFSEGNIAGWNFHLPTPASSGCPGVFGSSRSNMETTAEDVFGYRLLAKGLLTVVLVLSVGWAVLGAFGPEPTGLETATTLEPDA